MRFLCVLVVVCGALVGCAVNPYTAERGVPGKSVEAVYKCVVGQANRLGYALSQADKSTGFFKADKSFIPGMTSFSWGDKMRYELTLLITESAGDNGTKINITANKYRNGKQENTSSDLEGDADAIVRACSN